MEKIVYAYLNLSHLMDRFTFIQSNLTREAKRQLTSKRIYTHKTHTHIYIDYICGRFIHTYMIYAYIYKKF